MKKLLIIVLAMAMLFSACNSEGKNVFKITTEEKYVIEQDANFMLNGYGNRTLIAKAEDGYYLLLDDAMYHADEELNLTALCNKPNCLHAREAIPEDKQKCNAYISGIFKNNFFYFNHRIYVVTMKDVLKDEPIKIDGKICCGIYSMNENGGDKKMLPDFFPRTDKILFHRGYIYYVDYEQVEADNGKIITNTSLNKMSIISGEKEEIMCFEGRDQNVIAEILAYRNYVYFKNYDNIYVYSVLSESVISELALKSSELPYKVTKGGKENVRLSPTNIDFMDDKLLLRYNTDNNEIFISNLDGSNKSYALSLAHGVQNVSGVDDRYIYEDNRVSGEFIEKGARILHYYDKETYEYLGELNFGNISHKLCGYGDERYFFAIKEYDKDNNSLIYYDKKDFEKGKVEPKELFIIPKMRY